ncbi:4Fe-4S binding protein [Roseimaritima ulvae]|uniref:Electron transport protein YccM n=1 Tax=Roseimaritima ulvae TaxID=980254 RepID=A0A5B9R9S5_9BACT|nr:4Fe-4S binding protein [Roseimaritima ulvae]QEG43613.1 Putative electron transport protein YccM [Roseimaritima ulvae]
MKRIGLAIGSALLATAILVSVFSDRPTTWIEFPIAVSLAAAGVLLAIAALLLLTHFDTGRSAALLRLDVFSPALKRLKQGQQASHSLLGRGLRRVIPQAFQSNWTTKRRGLWRRTLRRIGLSWLAAPVRRVVQTVCLLTFGVLFFYVCWPYDATPKPAGKVSTNWTFSEMDQASGDLLFVGPHPLDWQTARNQDVFVTTTDPAGAAQPLVQRLKFVDATGDTVRLAPEADFTADAMDAFMLSTGTWSLHQSDPAAWPSHYTDNLAGKEFIPAETFLAIDPLVSLSTAIASRSWVWSLASAAIILIVCVLIPRGFCGYLCPLGTTIDFFDWAVGKRVTRFRVSGEGWWVHIKYYLLTGTLLCAVFGVLVSGFVSAIPVITRGMLFLFEPLQTGVFRGWHLVPGINIGQWISIALFVAVLSLGFLRPRFWCKYVCPSGAVFSLGNLFRVTERKVESSCINCNKCVEICPFDAIKPDFTTRTTDCTLCQSCAGVCPTHAIKFVERWNLVELKVPNDPPTQETAIGRRGFLSLAGGTAAAISGGAGLALATKTWGADLEDPDAFRPVRPPGSVPEKEFLEMCIRCGECFKACPNNVLQPEAFQQGLEGLWTPLVNANWAGCESSCNACGQVCPTGSIRALPLAEKKVARMGLAIVNESTCLPFAGREACDLCVVECNAAGYRAIEFKQVGTEVDQDGVPIAGTGFSAPVVLADKCVGCGLCQTRCHAINVKDKGLLAESAIIIEAGEGKEDRLMSGSYIELHEQRSAEQTEKGSGGDYFVPTTESAEQNPKPAASPDADPFGVPASPPPTEDDDPFGIR